VPTRSTPLLASDGSAQTRLTNNTAHDGDPAWSPDGTRMAFQSERDGDLEIFTMALNGSAQTRLTNNPADDSGPASDRPAQDARWPSRQHKIALRTQITSPQPTFLRAQYRRY
jgi:Tol biopolymer transport system component